MIKIIPASERHYQDFGWLKTYWLFSFGDYYDPENKNLGALRVFNDDVVAPGQGFGTHPHRDMEIVTIILEGVITHEDSMGNKETIKAGEVQRMTAGTGVMHSEFNKGKEPLKFYQVWITPHEKGLPPSYQQQKFDISSKKNELVPVVTGRGIEGTLHLHQDATIYMAEFDKDFEYTYTGAPVRKVFIYITSGSLVVNDKTLNSRDQARITDTEVLKLKATEDTKFIFIDVP